MKSALYDGQVFVMCGEFGWLAGKGNNFISFCKRLFNECLPASPGPPKIVSFILCHFHIYS
jgi:hypothetical protein